MDDDKTFNDGEKRFYEDEKTSEERKLFTKMTKLSTMITFNDDFFFVYFISILPDLGPRVVPKSCRLNK